MNKYNLLRILLLLLLLIILITSSIHFYKNEKFNLGIGKSFGMFYLPEKCEHKDNCFKGAYFRSQLYNNMCEPKNGELLKIPVQLNDNCVKSL